MKNITVYTQIKPSINTCWKDVKVSKSNQNVYVRCIQDFGKGKNIAIPNYYTFPSDGVLYKLNQAEIYDTVMPESLEKAILGTDVLIFAYGQTGSGKSCTLSGLQNPYEGRGLIPRIITRLFELKEKSKHESKIKYRISFVEVTKSSIIDLLQNEKNKNVHKNLQTVKLKTVQDGLRYLFQGEGQRKFQYNVYVSNLFTSVFTIHVQNCSTIISNAVDRNAKIHIIDMAGMDCSGNMSCIWKKSQQVGIANLNKSQLEFCLRLMRKEELVKTGRFIKDAGLLVNYLKDSLKAESIIKFIAHINTTRDDLPLTISALKFANTARRIHCTELTQFVTESSSLIIKRLKNEVADLKKQHDLNSMLRNDDLSYNITQSRLDQMKNAVDDYMNDKSNELSLQHVTDISTVLKIMKDKCAMLENEKTDLIKLQNQRRSTVSQKLSKGSSSVIPVATFNEKQSSKTTRTTSYGSQISKKRKSSDIASKRSKQNSMLEIKTSLVGNTTRSGISLGQLMTQNATKSFKRKSKRIKATGSKETIIPNDLSNENIEPQISELNLENLLGDNFDETWNSYEMDENFHYTDMNKDLKTLEECTSDLIKQYVAICKELESTSQLINLKKNDLLKIQLYTDTINYKCKPDGKIRINETEQTVKDKINQLNNDMIFLQEKILTLRTEITIQSTDYHRVKCNIHEDFQKFCVDKFKIKIPFMQQNTDCIEDKILHLQVENVETTDLEETKQKDIYYKLQEKLKKVQQEKLI